MARRKGKRHTRKPSKTRRQRGGNVLNYLLPFVFMKAKNMLANKTRKNKRKSKKK